MSSFQILDTCPICQVESALDRTFDADHPCCLLGVSASSTCDLCGRKTVGSVSPHCGTPADTELRMKQDLCPACGDQMDGEEQLEHRCGACGATAEELEVEPPMFFDTVGQLRHALELWAEVRGYVDLQTFIDSCFVDDSVEAIFQHIAAGEPVHTTMDVLSSLFIGGEAASDETVSPAEEDLPTEDATEQDLQVPEPEPEPEPEPWTSVLPLISVMMADGRVHPDEEVFVGRLLEAFNSPPVPPEMLRVHAPADVPAPRTKRDRLRMIEAMVHLLHLDQRRTGAEFQIVRKYAAAWGISPKWVAHYDLAYGKQYATGVRRLWLILNSALS